jgi:hypothetical protein
MRSISQMVGLTSRAARPGKARVSAGLAAGIVFAAALALLGIVYVGFVLWPRHLSVVPPDTPSVPITVAGVVFNVPPAAVRQQVQRRSGAQDRIDLVFLWPSLDPPDPGRQAEKHGPSEELQPIGRLFVTIAGNSGALSPAERMKSIYPRYVAEDVRTEAGGLVARQFVETSPYRGEDLVFDATAPERFVTRCSRSGATPAMCLLERRIGAADITFRFPRDWLTEWRELAAKIDYLIATLRPPVR